MRRGTTLAALIPAMTALACATLPTTSRPGRGCGFGAGDFSTDTTIDLHGVSDPPPIKLHSRFPPRYPDDMRAQEIDGRVVVSYVIDTAGHVPRGSIWIESESRREFGQAVCEWLGRTTYDPVRVNGRIVSVYVRNSPIGFAIMP